MPIKLSGIFSSAEERIKRTEAYAEKVRMMFAATVNDILALNKTLPKLDEGTMYSFDGENMKTQKEVERLLRRLHSAVVMAIKQGITFEWEQANRECDKLVSSAFGEEVLNSTKFKAWTQRNTEAMHAFINRSDNGLNLSDRVWKPVRQLRDEMEVAITIGIGEGESAASMSRRVRQYLNDPDLMFRRFRYKNDKGEWKLKWKKRIKDEDTGKYKWIDYDKDSYRDDWTGKGYYKSSAQNAMRVTRTETNIAYRRADHERWSQMDFVLGQRVKLSHSHPVEDICDKLQGDYPKDFVFEGWHPQCFCYVTPILVDESEMGKVNEAFSKGKVYTPQGKLVTEYPEDFKSWVKDHRDNIVNARKRGTEPYFIKHNASVIDNILNPKKPLTTAEKAKIRHDARTAEQIEAIKEQWAARQKKHALIKKIANNVLKVAEDYSEVDYSKLQQYISDGNLTAMQAEAKAVAKAVSAMKKQESALSDLIPDVHSLHKQFTMMELQEAYTDLNNVMNKWLTKYGYSSIDSAPLQHLKNKLDFELTNPTLNYTQKEIINKSLTAKIQIIEQQIAWNDLISKSATLRSFQTKSSVYKIYLTKINDAIQSKDFNALQKSIIDAEAQQQRLIIQKIKRRGNTKSALNAEYKGSVTGRDMTSEIDVKTMTSEDPYNKNSFTNNIARMQGFDAPAKLISEQEFIILEKSFGEVFYRTVNPTTFRGKKMSSKEFASQLYKADRLELNGPGGRVYGDGMYVATSAWDGDTLNALTDHGKKNAYDSSIIYGNGNHTISEMTFVRKPKIIKQTDLSNMWNKLSKERQAAFGYNQNTYACALGYDAMYCKGPNYMVIWNRSIIAVKKQ